MKQTIRKTDILVLLGVFALAFLVMFGIQRISGRIDGVASMVFVLAVFLISIYTDGYFWGVMASLLSVLAVNFAFRSPYFAFNFTLPERAMLWVLESLRRFFGILAAPLVVILLRLPARTAPVPPWPFPMRRTVLPDGSAGRQVHRSFPAEAAGRCTLPAS